MNDSSKTEAEIKKAREEESEKVKKDTENKWYSVVNQYKEEIRAKEAIIERKDKLIADQEGEIIQLKKEMGKLEEKLKQSESDFVFLSRQKKDEIGLVDKRPNFFWELPQKERI